HSIKQARAYLPHALDLALIDINLPDGSGLDFAREMRAHEKHSDTDVIVASIDDGIPNVNRAYDDARAITFVSKPIRWRDLVQLLRAIHAERVLRAPNDGRSGSIAGSHAHS
ncbi:MAG: response regulator, partial [Pseudomonadota bacterium]